MLARRVFTHARRLFGRRMMSTVEWTGSSPVPIISVEALNGTDAAKKAELAKEIDKACSDVGFLVIKDHGVPQDVIEKCWATTRKYFDLPDAVKAKDVTPDEKTYPYGYTPFGAETLQAGKDAEEGKRVAHAPDLKECFSIGPYDPKSGAPAPRWPNQPFEFREHWLGYYMAMERLAARLMQGFALALDLPGDYFVDKTDRHRSALRALNYPDLAGPPLPGQLRASGHTDYGALTILRADPSPGGLQVQTHDGVWHSVPEIKDSFVINLGDLMARWTNDRWTSTPHRVVPPPPDATGSCRRQSIAFFHNVNADLRIECLPTCITPDQPAKYPPVAAFEFLMQKHLASMGQYV